MGVARNASKEVEIEIGLGIHGEKGLKVVPNDGLIRSVLDLFESVIKSGDDVVVLLNNLGALTDLESS